MAVVRRTDQAALMKRFASDVRDGALGTAIWAKSQAAKSSSEIQFWEIWVVIRWKLVVALGALI
ncbi:hypothetical protein U1Q18_001138 [Sarracenia purpurea var. burkii]